MGKDPPRIRIVADDRERAGGVMAALSVRGDVELTVRRLPAGDYLVEDRFAVERKALADFAGSVIDARLFKQAAALARGPRNGVLLLEGVEREAGEGGVRRAALQGALITVTIFYGLAVLHTRDPNETAQVLVYLGRQAAHFVRGAVPRPGYRPKGRRARQLFVLQGLPGVGPARAARLLDHFGSVQNVALAPAEQLAAVEGMGAVTAARIRWALEAEPANPPLTLAGAPHSLNPPLPCPFSRHEPHPQAR